MKNGSFKVVQSVQVIDFEAGRREANFIGSGIMQIIRDPVD
jgi:hypothetical protein